MLCSLLLFDFFGPIASPFGEFASRIPELVEEHVDPTVYFLFEGRFGFEDETFQDKTDAHGDAVPEEFVSIDIDTGDFSQCIHEDILRPKFLFESVVVAAYRFLLLVGFRFQLPDPSAQFVQGSYRLLIHGSDRLRWNG